MNQLAYVNKVYKFINEVLIPKYDCLEKCNMHIIPEKFGLRAKAEFIIKVKEDLDEWDFSVIDYMINIKLNEFDEEFLEKNYYKPYIYVLVRQ